MKQATFINASQWQQFQCGTKRIYTPNQEIMDCIQQKQAGTLFWPHTYTAFVCIIYDEDLQKITAVRDHFGLEPCYYSIINKTFIFGSSIPAILKHMTSHPEINQTQIKELFFNKWFNTETYTDETYYQSIYRLEPGCELSLNLQGDRISSKKKSYWDLQECNQTIYYADERDYVVHFSELLSQALQPYKSQNIAAEFSGGLDSSAVVVAAHQNNIRPTLYMHVAPNDCGINDDLAQAQILIHDLGIKNTRYIDATEFDLIEGMNEYAHYFAGAAPYNGFVLNHALHCAIAKQKHEVVLSGIGGDECVSSHAPLKACFSQLIREQGKHAAWRELGNHYQVKGIPPPNFLKRCVNWMRLAYQSPPKLCKHEYNLLQGPGSHHLRSRIEYNAVLAKAKGFRYVYPLLYPPLVEFCYQLPLSQKRNKGISRCLMRDYLAQFFSSKLYGKQLKSGSVTPAALEKTKKAYQAGTYDTLFQNLPFQKDRNYLKKHGKDAYKKYPFMSEIPAYMFKTYWDNGSFIP